MPCALIRQALDLGVNLLDTAAVYGTEEVVGKALRGVPRDSVVLCTKASRAAGRLAVRSPRRCWPAWTLRCAGWGVDGVDVFQLHAVPPSQYQHVRNEIAPALQKARDAGKFRFLGITETAPNDVEQHMLHRAAQDDVWDTVMVAFHMMHQAGAHAGVPLHAAEPHRHAADVRGARHLRPPRAARVGGAPPGRRRRPAA